MSLLLKDDLYSSQEETFLDEENSFYEKLGLSINNFIGESSSILLGDVWDALRERLDTQLSALSVKRDNNTNISNMIKEAKSSMIAFMEDYDEINSNNILELEQCVNNLSKNIHNTEVLLNSYMGKYLQSIYNEQDVDSNIIDSIYQIRKQLDDMKEYYLEVSKLYQKVKELDSTDNAVFAKITYSNDFNNL